MLKKKEILEILETKKWWQKLFIEGKVWEKAGHFQIEIDILEQILEINQDD